MKSIAIHVTATGDDRVVVEADMMELANMTGFPVTASFGGKYICKIPAPVSTCTGSSGVNDLMNMFGMR